MPIGESTRGSLPISRPKVGGGGPPSRQFLNFECVYVRF